MQKVEEITRNLWNYFIATEITLNITKLKNIYKGVRGDFKHKIRQVLREKLKYVVLEETFNLDLFLII